MTADPQYLAAVEARANAATEGPWAVMRDAEGRPWVGKADGPFVGDDPAQDDADATFQAHAREDIPRLVALVREAEDDRDGWKDAAETYRSSRDASDARADAARAEVERLRGLLEAATLRLTADVTNLGAVSVAAMERQHVETDRDAARAALAALVADLRALCDGPDHLGLTRVALMADDVRALADRYDGGEGR